MLHSLLLVFISTSSRSTHKYLFRNTSICNFLKFIFTENFSSDSKITKSLHCVAHTLWKNEKFTLTKYLFRQINSLVISFLKPLISRNICQKCVRVNFRNFHTVAQYHRCCGKMKKVLSSPRKISSNQLFSYFFSKKRHFHEIFSKIV